MIKTIHLALLGVLIITLASCTSQKTAHFSNSRFIKRALNNINNEQTKIKELDAIQTASVEEEPETALVTETENEIIVDAEEKQVELEKIKESIILYSSKTKAEKREIKKELKKQISSGIVDMPPTSRELSPEQVLVIVLAFLLPPLAVFLVKGISTQFWISLLLSLLIYGHLLFWLIPVAYALYVIFT